MAGQSNTQNVEPRQLCTVCSQFYGTQATNFLCSKCFKEQPLNEVKLSKTSSKTCQIEPTFTSVSPKEEVKESIVKAEPIEEQAPVKQEKDHSRCLTCSKKVGLLGFKCQCESTFCRNHRMPEMHDCTFDFGKVGKERLAKENLVVKADKVVKF